MKKIVMIATIALLCIAGTLFSSGCTEQKQTNETEGAKTSPFIGGTQALQMELIGLPSQYIYSGDSFKIMLQATNKGEHTISEDQVNFFLPATYDTTYALSDISIPNENTLQKAQRAPDGSVIYMGRENVDFGSASVIRTYDHTDKISAYACYPYMTYGIAEVCLGASNLYTDTSGKGCKPYGSKRIYTSSGPLKISRVDEYGDIEKGEYTFTIAIDKVGVGEVRPAGSETCDPASSIEMEVMCEADWAKGSYKGTALLIGGKGQFQCDLTSAAMSSVSEEQPMKITIGPYNHLISAEGSVTIRAKPGEALGDKVKDKVNSRY